MTDTIGAIGRPRGTYAKTAAKRVAILDAALEVFAESGYRAGSLREVATRVGMSEAGLLHHFPNKGVLLQAVLDHRDDRSRAVVDFDHEDGRVGLRGLISLALYNQSIPGVVELYCTLSAEATAPAHPAHAYFVNRYAYVRRSVGETFTRLREAGRLRADVDPARAAIATVAFMDGLQVQWLLDRDAVDMAEELAAMFDAMVDFGEGESAMTGVVAIQPEEDAA